MIVLRAVGMIALIIIPVILFWGFSTFDYLCAGVNNKKRKKNISEYKNDYSLFGRITLLPLKKSKSFKLFYYMAYINLVSMIIALVFFILSLLNEQLPYQRNFAYSTSAHLLLSLVFFAVVLEDIRKR